LSGTVNVINVWQTILSITDMDIPDRAIQVGGAREGQSFVLKV
jgi:hypothetical protein